MNVLYFFLFPIFLFFLNIPSKSQTKVETKRYTLQNLKSLASEEQFILDTIGCDLNGDKVRDLIVVLDAKTNYKENAQHQFPLPMYILKGDGKGLTFWMKNDRIVEDLDDNCPADGYQRIVSKQSYFTVENTSCSDNFYVTQFATFKFSKDVDNILLHKFGIKKINRDNPDQAIPDRVYTAKDFGKIKFEEFDIRKFVLKKR